MIENKDNVLNLILPISPSVNEIYVPKCTTTYGKGGRSFAKPSIYETAEAKKFKRDMAKYIQEEVVKQGFIKREGVFTFLEWTFFFPHTKMDDNNFLKLNCDGISQSNCIWTDDNWGVNKTTRIFYDSENPRVLLKLYYADWVGLFNSKEDHDSFVENNCKLCSRGSKIGLRGGCMVYRDILDNRIKPESYDFDYESGSLECLKFKNKKTNKGKA